MESSAYAKLAYLLRTDLCDGMNYIFLLSVVDKYINIAENEIAKVKSVETHFPRGTYFFDNVQTIQDFFYIV